MALFNWLKDLDVGGNKFSSDLSFLSYLVNLKELKLGNNHFTGSLEPLKKLTNLKELNIDNTGLDADCQYLPNSLQRINANGKIREELARYGNSLSEHSNLMPDNKKIVTAVPQELENNKISEPNYEWKLKSYSKFILKDKQPFSWEKKSQESQTPKTSTVLEPPLRLYNMKIGQIEKEAKREFGPGMPDYAILSYVWGNREGSEVKIMK